MQNLCYKVESEKETGHGTITVFKVQEKGIKGTVGEQVNSKVNCLWKRKKRKKEEKEREKTEEEEQEQGRIRTSGILERVVNYGNVSLSLLITVHH